MSSAPLPLDTAPMEAVQQATLPAGPEWRYEPKWDGFRCLAFRDGAEIELRSKASRPLGRYFPDVVGALAALPARGFVLDGELLVPVDGALSFEELQLRLHPAARRVAMLAAAHPAIYVVFDLLADEHGRSLLALPLLERRAALERFAAAHLAAGGAVRLSPQTGDLARAAGWLEEGRNGLDGVMAKRADLAYRAGLRDGMVKVKRERTVDCVVGGYRRGEGTRLVGSLLLGLYDDEGLLHHVGHTSGLSHRERQRLTPLLEALAGDPGFTGRSPGGPSRWSPERSGDYERLRHELVVEVGFDHITAGRFRHGTRLRRFRPDKAPRQCTLEQLAPPGESPLALFGP